mgnify:CR=1 FL=1
MESTKTRILKKLLETDGYLSGQELCEQLGISRTAVWKYMKQLKEEGYEIEAVQNKGYCLKDVPDVLGESEIKSRLHTRWAGQTLYYYDEIDSTNTQIKRLAEEDAPHGTLAVADYQSKGKGRRGHAWDSPHGSAIYMSILFRPDIRPDRASMLTLVIGLSVAQAIRSNLGVQAQIKWPNDIVLKISRNSDRDERADELYRISGDGNRNQCQPAGISGGTGGQSHFSAKRDRA